MPFITRMSSWNTSSCVWEWWVRTLESFPVPDWDLFHKWAPQMLLKPHYGELHPNFVNRIHTGPWYSKVHPFRIIYHVQRMGGWELQRTRSDYPNWTPLLRRLGKPPMWRAVSCILYIVSTPGVACCLVPSIQDLSIRQRDGWELRRKQSGWTPSSQSPIPDHLPCQTDEWELLGMRSGLYITVW